MSTKIPSSFRELRRQRGLSMPAVSVLAGVDTAAISRIESGQARATPATIVRLAQALGIGPRRMARICDQAWRDREARQTSSQTEQLRRIDIDAMSGTA